ncbi:hypothetical protein pb186bvf_002008 [Paramecium bursaria]
MDKLLQELQRYSGNQVQIRFYLLAVRMKLPSRDVIEYMKNTQFQFLLNEYCTKNGQQMPTKQLYEKKRTEILNKKGELQNYKNQQSKSTLRELSKQYAELNFNHGDFNEAYQGYLKVYEHTQPTQSQIDFCIDWIDTMIWSFQITHFRLITLKPSNDQQYAQYQVSCLVKHFQKYEYAEFVSTFLKINPDYISVDHITCYYDLARYFLIVALQTKSTKEIIELIQYPIIQHLNEQQPIVFEVIYAYEDYDFENLVKQVNQILKDLQYDAIIYSDLQRIGMELKSFLVKQYIQIYKRASIKNLAQSLQLEVRQTIDILEDVIRKDNMNYLIDPVDLIIIQKRSQEQQRLASFNEITKELLKQIDNRYLQLFQ